MNSVNVVLVKGDISKEETAEQLIKVAVERFGKIDRFAIFIYNRLVSGTVSNIIKFS